jgi:hypothetical protein
MSAQLSLVPTYQPRPQRLGPRLFWGTVSRAAVVLRLAPPRHTPGEHPLDHLELPPPVGAVRQPTISQLSVASSG